MELMATSERNVGGNRVLRIAYDGDIFSLVWNGTEGGGGSDWREVEREREW